MTCVSRLRTRRPATLRAGCTEPRSRLPSPPSKSYRSTTSPPLPPSRRTHRYRAEAYSCRCRRPSSTRHGRHIHPPNPDHSAERERCPWRRKIDHFVRTTLPPSRPSSSPSRRETRRRMTNRRRRLDFVDKWIQLIDWNERSIQISRSVDDWSATNSQSRSVCTMGRSSSRRRRRLEREDVETDVSASSKNKAMSSREDATRSLLATPSRT